MVKVKNWGGADNKGSRKMSLCPGILLALIALLLFASICSLNCSDQPQYQSTPKAAIIDQLFSSYPNRVLTEKITRYLEDYGFQVDTYQGDNVTVDFYRGLAKLDYKLLIIRSHSGRVSYTGKPESNLNTYLFTAELYSKWKYTAEQMTDQIMRGSVDYGESIFFAIGPKFITASMAGRLDNTVVIVDGCSGLYQLDLARAFIDKGASAYIAFSAAVNLDHADEVTLSLVKNLCSADSTVARAVGDSMMEKGRDPESNAVLEYYPPGIGDSTIGALTRLR
jgi:hypothetical protein